MRSGFIISLIAVLLFSGGYLYYTARAICPAPLEYRIGEFDERFGITTDEARLVISEAEAVWEDATGRNLFTYNTNAEFPINFIFDDRQALADAEEDFLGRLNETQARNAAINSTYEELVAEYEALGTAYQARVAMYEASLDEYNNIVAEYNREGGAPPEAFAQLESDRAALDQGRADLQRQSQQLNGLVAKINQISDQGNQLINTYNQNVATYNDTFGGSHEFTQGDYRGDSINIYKFSDRAELRTVLAHELGHALGVDHVEGASSVMYYLMGGQPADVSLTPFDLNEFVRVCGTDESTVGYIIRGLQLYIENLQKQLLNQ